MLGASEPAASSTSRSFPTQQPRSADGLPPRDRFLRVRRDLGRGRATGGIPTRTRPSRHCAGGLRPRNRRPLRLTFRRLCGAGCSRVLRRLRALDRRAALPRGGHAGGVRLASGRGGRSGGPLRRARLRRLSRGLRLGLVQGWRDRHRGDRPGPVRARRAGDRGGWRAGARRARRRHRRLARARSPVSAGLVPVLFVAVALVAVGAFVATWKRDLSSALAGLPLMFGGAGGAFARAARFSAAGGPKIFGQEVAVLLAVAALALVALGVGIAGRGTSR